MDKLADRTASEVAFSARRARPALGVVRLRAWGEAMPAALGASIFAGLALLRIAGAYAALLAVVAVALTPLALAAVPRDRWPEIGLRRPRPGSVLAGTTLVLATYALVVTACQLIFGGGSSNWITWLPRLFRNIVPGPPAARFVAMVACLGVLVPIAEELFYRGVLHHLIGRRMGSIGTVVLTAAGWAAVHLGDYGLHPLNLEVAAGAVASVFVMGLALGICRVRSGSFLASAVAQGVANLALLAWALGT
jgi:uncharacterized protein